MHSIAVDAGARSDDTSHSRGLRSLRANRVAG